MKSLLMLMLFFLLNGIALAGGKPVAGSAVRGDAVRIDPSQDSPIIRRTTPRDGKSALFTGNPSADLFGLSNASLNEDRAFRFQDSLSVEPSSPDEKNPWLATGLSAVVPGAGEFYSKSYIKSGIFFAVEIAAFLLQKNFNNKGDDQTTFFENYADKHYSADQYAQWTLNNASALNPDVNPNNYHVFNSGQPAGPPYADINWGELNRLEQAIANRTDGKFNGYTHSMPYYAEQQYFELIGKYFQFSPGWDSADPNKAYQESWGGSWESEFGYAQWHTYYADQRALANHYYDIAGTYVGIIVANHLLSALDAYWTTKRFNNSLHAGMSMSLHPTLTGMAAVPEANFRYTF